MLRLNKFITRSNAFSNIIKFSQSNNPSETQENSLPLEKGGISDREMTYFKNLRIFMDCSNLELGNLFVINKLLHYGSFVNNAHIFYKLSSKVLGQTITELIIKKTMGQVFIGGDKLEEVMPFAKKLKERSNINYPDNSCNNIDSFLDVPIILDYCCEALQDNESEFVKISLLSRSQLYLILQQMDRSAKIFQKTVTVGDNIARHKISIKLSGLCNINLLKRLNCIQEQQQKLFSSIDKDNNGFITAAQLFEKLISDGYKVEEADVVDFVKNVLMINNEGLSLEETQISKLIWRIRVHPYYIESSQNDINIVKQLSKLSSKEISKADNFLLRVDSILNSAHLNRARVLIDAEQSYIQRAIDSFIEQYQLKYNKVDPIVYTTFQNYLKTSSERIRYEIDKCKLLNIPFGIKMVRGAYVNEETKIAKEHNTESPVCEGLEKTTHMIEQNLKFLVDNLLPRSELLLGSHNKETVEKMKEYMKEKGIPKNTPSIYFSQLLGLADHITYSLVKEGYQVYKYIPFGETHIMIPYLIRRAQESFQVLSSVELQYALLKDEGLRRSPFYY